MISNYPNSSALSLWCVGSLNLDFTESKWGSLRVQSLIAPTLHSYGHYTLRAGRGDQNENLKEAKGDSLWQKNSQNAFYSISTVLGKMKSLKSYLIIITHKTECVCLFGAGH